MRIYPSPLLYRPLEFVQLLPFAIPASPFSYCTSLRMSIRSWPGPVVRIPRQERLRKLAGYGRRRPSERWEEVSLEITRTADVVDDVLADGLSAERTATALLCVDVWAGKCEDKGSKRTAKTNRSRS
jgi:hypothetical protein